MNKLYLNNYIATSKCLEYYTIIMSIFTFTVDNEYVFPSIRKVSPYFIYIVFIINIYVPIKTILRIF